MSEEPEIVEADFKRKAVLKRMKVDPETKPMQFLTAWKKFCKLTKVKSVIVMTVDENNYVEWGSLTDNDSHLYLMALCVEDVKEELKAEIFGPQEYVLE